MLLCMSRSFLSEICNSFSVVRKKCILYKKDSRIRKRTHKCVDLASQIVGITTVCFVSNVFVCLFGRHKCPPMQSSVVCLLDFWLLFVCLLCPLASQEDTQVSVFCLFGPVPCSYILFSVRFRTDSSSVRKKILIILILFSEPIPVRFGIFGMDFLTTFPNRFQFGLEKIFEIVIPFSEPNSIEQKLWHFTKQKFRSVQCMLRFRIWPNINILTNRTVCRPYGGGVCVCGEGGLVFGPSCYCFETRGMLTNSVFSWPHKKWFWA